MELLAFYFDSKRDFRISTKHMENTREISTNLDPKQKSNDQKSTKIAWF